MKRIFTSVWLAIVPLVFASMFIPTVVLGSHEGGASNVNCEPDPCAGVDTAAHCMAHNAICTGGQAGAGLTDTDQPFSVIIGNLIKGLLGFLGIVFMILIMYGGFVWMTAAGNDDRIRTAKKIISNSAIGLFIVIISYALSIWIFDVIIDATNADQF